MDGRWNPGSDVIARRVADQRRAGLGLRRAIMIRPIIAEPVVLPKGLNRRGSSEEIQMHGGKLGHDQRGRGERPESGEHLEAEPACLADHQAITGFLALDEQ